MTAQYTSWRKSHHSEPNGSCVELARSTQGTIGVRDSKAGNDSPILEFTPAAWAAFLRKIRQLRQS